MISVTMNFDWNANERRPRLPPMQEDLAQTVIGDDRYRLYGMHVLTEQPIEIEFDGHLIKTIRPVQELLLLAQDRQRVGDTFARLQGTRVRLIPGAMHYFVPLTPQLREVWCEPSQFGQGMNRPSRHARPLPPMLVRIDLSAALKKGTRRNDSNRLPKRFTLPASRSR